MDNNFNALLDFLTEHLTQRGFTIESSVKKNPDQLPVRNGYKPDLVATYKNVKTVYGKVEFPEDTSNVEQWERLKALSRDSTVELYIVFPEEVKMQLVLALINGKLSDKKNIIRLYR